MSLTMTLLIHGLLSSDVEPRSIPNISDLLTIAFSDI